MSNSEINKKRYTVLRGFASMSVSEKIDMARTFVSRMTSNAFFTTPTPVLADVLNDALLLEQALEDSHDRGRTARRILLNREKGLEYTLIALFQYVERIANAEATPDVVIASAGMEYRVSEGRNPQVFSVKIGKLKGTAIVTAAHVKGASYEWEYRLKGAADWIPAATTLKASFLFSGLTSGSTYEFRQKTITRTGETDWTSPDETVIL
jgi:hypothetical protein